jgi:response regulator RpfG family c-di-GMP phosphodiesterase
MKIFICDQDVAKAKSMQAILGAYNYKVVTVEKQTELIRGITQHKPAVIIINHRFSKNSGMDTVNRLKTDPATSGIPIIYIGDEALEEEYSYMNTTDMIEFIEEPIRIKNLRHYIDRWTTFRSIYVRH